MQFTIDIPFYTLNKYRNNHYRRNHQDKQDVLLAMMPICRKLKPVVGTIGIRYDFVCKTKRRRDLDNLAVCKKYIHDALVHYGIIPDDSMNVITETVEYAYIGNKEQYINVTIYESNPQEAPRRIEQ